MARRSGVSRAVLPGMQQRLRRSLLALGPVANDGLVLGFSGGGDSVALAHALGAVAAVRALPLRLVHVDHGWRPRSTGEAERAVEIAETMGLSCRIVRLKRAESAGGEGGATADHADEQSARVGRYQALAEAALNAGASVVVVAHHQRDQAETVLLHLLRGAGTTGAAGMAERSDYPVPTVGRPLTLWRPLIDEAAETVALYRRELNLPFVVDPSNDDHRFSRNRLRRQLLPVLEQVQPGAVAALARYGEIAAADDAALRTLSEALRRSAVSGQGVRRSEFVEAPIALQRRVLLGWLRDGGVTEPSFERVEAVREWLAKGGGDQQLEVGLGWVVRDEPPFVTLTRTAESPAAMGGRKGR